MDGTGMISALENFGPLGLAIGIAGIIGWAIYTKVIKPQQEAIRKEANAHIETLQKLLEDSGDRTREFIDSSRENIIALKELNGKISTHHEIMQKDHEVMTDKLK